MFTFLARLSLPLALVCLAWPGCASGIGAERAASALELRSAPTSMPEKFQAARLWFSLTDVVGADGMQGGPINAVSAELTDLVNQAMVDQLRRRAGEVRLFSLAVPANADFGQAVTMPPSNYLDVRLIRSSLWAAAPPNHEWSVALRNEVVYNVFSDTVELQVASVLTLFDPSGTPRWQAAARSQKYYENWGTGDHLASLSAKFVMDAARENTRRLLAHAH